MIDIDIVGQLLPNPLTMIVQLCSTLVLFLLMIPLIAVIPYTEKALRNTFDMEGNRLR